MTREQLKEIIQDAIQDEINSHEFYKAAAEKVNNDTIRDMFLKLSQDELGHKEFLEGFLESRATTIQLDAGEDYGIAETFDNPPLTTDMSFVDAMKLAVKHEEQAMAKYQHLANACTQNDEKELFLGLKEMELTHKNRLEELYLNVAYTEAW